MRPHDSTVRALLLALHILCSPQCGAPLDMLTPEAIQRLHRRVSGSRVSLIEDAGHSVPTDQPAALSLNIREFLQSIASL